METSPVIKILVVGDAGVGKTSVIQRYVNDIFSPTHQPTVGVDFFIKEIALESDRSGSSSQNCVRVQLWDIAGQDRSKKVNRVYFKGALGALIVYDISRPQTFDSAAKWKQELDASITLPNGNGVPVVLLGNKVDLEVAKVDVSYIDSFVNTHGFVAWSDVSAKETSNADFELSIACLINRLLCDEELFGPGMSFLSACMPRSHLSLPLPVSTVPYLIPKAECQRLLEENTRARFTARLFIGVRGASTGGRVT